MTPAIMNHIVHSSKIAHHNVTRESILSAQLQRGGTISFSLDEEKVCLYLSQFAIKDQWVGVGKSIENKQSGVLNIYLHKKQDWHLFIVNLQGTIDEYHSKVRALKLQLKQANRNLKQRGRNSHLGWGGATPSTISGGESDDEGGSRRSSLSESSLRDQLREETSKTLTLEEQINHKDKKLVAYKQRYSELINKYQQSSKQHQSIIASKDELQEDYEMTQSRLETLQADFDNLEEKYENMIRHQASTEKERDQLWDENQTLSILLQEYESKENVTFHLDKKFGFEKSIFPVQKTAINLLSELILPDVIEHYGSSVYHLMTEQSDLDIAVLIDQQHDHSVSASRVLLDKLEMVKKKIEQSEPCQFKILNQINHKNLPPRLELMFENLHIDLSFYHRSKFINFVKERDKRILKVTRDESLRRFLLLVKCWAQRNEICSGKPDSCTLGTYAWIMICIFFINMTKRKAKEDNTKIPSDPCILFQDFIQFGYEFFQPSTHVNYKKYALDPASGELVKRQWRRSLNSFVMDVVDPVEIPKPYSAERNIAHTLNMPGKDKILNVLKQTSESLAREQMFGIDRAIVRLVFQNHKDG